MQPASFWLGHLADASSRGTEAFATTRHEYANPAFAYAVNGTIVTGFNPWYPDDRYGTEPDRLLPRMKEAGFDPDDEDGQYRQSTSRSLRLIGSVTGVLPTADQVNGPLPSMQFDHWFSRTRPSSSENDPCTG